MLNPEDQEPPPYAKAIMALYGLIHFSPKVLRQLAQVVLTAPMDEHLNPAHQLQLRTAVSMLLDLLASDTELVDATVD